jgi:hypothetical protein
MDSEKRPMASSMRLLASPSGAKGSAMARTSSLAYA